MNEVWKQIQKTMLFPIHQYFKESQMRLHPERFDKKPLVQVSTQVKSEPLRKPEVKSEVNKDDGFDDMEDFDVWLVFILHLVRVLCISF